MPSTSQNFKFSKLNAAYPPLLRYIPKPPEILYCTGLPLNPNDKYFSVVGTRRPSLYGKQMAHDFAYQLAKNGFTIVSGLAYGIDSIAHEAALEAGGRTIAVLGCGLNHLHSLWNKDLAKRIQKNGCLITEFLPETAPAKYTFVQRNRIIAGMSIATLVIEAPEKSGALITARYALDFNRDVFTIPSNITQDSGKGTNALIRDCKACPITCLQDIWDFMGIAAQNPHTNTAKLPLTFLSETENKIYELLKSAPQTVDQLIAAAALPAQEISVALSMLELKKIIKISGAYAVLMR